jgi:hypothetical protein
MTHPAREPDPAQQFLRAAARSLRVPPRDAQRHHHVFERAELPQQVVKLKNESNSAIAESRKLLVRSILQPLSVNRYRASRRAVERTEEMQESALSCTAGSNDRHHFTARDLKVDAVEDR